MSESKQPKKRMERAKGTSSGTPPTPATKKAAEQFQAVEIPKRRAAMIMVSPGEFIFLFTKGLRFQKNFKVVEGIPEDAKLIAVAPDSIRNGIMLVITSSQFDELPINVLPPVIPVKIDLDGIKNATKKKNIPDRKKKKK